MILRRLGALGAAALTLVVFVGPPAAADELSDYLEHADDAVYSGRRIVFTVWDGQSRFALLDVEHADGMSVVTRYGDHVMIGGGKIRPLSSGDGGIQFTQWTQPDAIDRYEVVVVGPVMHAGRRARLVEVMEDGNLRARLKFDQQTSAPVVTEVFGGSGELFRYSAMVEFEPSAVSMPGEESDTADYAVASPEAMDLPAMASHYQLVDSYAAADGSAQGFYTDGLFSFSMFVIDGRADLEKMGDGEPFMIQGSEYRVSAAPMELWVMWTTGSDTYVLVGDLPPDHLEDVLVDIPRPVHRNWFQRAWHRLFG